MKNISSEESRKIFNYGNHIVVVDYNKNTVITRWMCGCCRQFGAINHGIYATCEVCASPRSKS